LQGEFSKTITKTVMINKIFLTFIVVALWIFASVWCFNHINAWIGIGLFILGTYISVKQLNKTSKNKEK
jgi:RsiW-degrading membrane proteinase PrsW (M82 family)